MTQDVQERISAILSGTPPESTAKAEKAEEPVKPSEESTETPQGDTEKPNRRRKMKLGDHEFEIDILTDDESLIDLVPKGLQMEADYTKKTMKLAEDRKAVEAELGKFREKVTDLEQALELDIQDLESAEMKELREYDPDAFLRKVDKAKAKEKKLNKYKQELFERDQKSMQEKAKAEIDLWEQAIPDWLDGEVKSKELKMISKSLQDAGFKDEELQLMFDHRLIKQLRKAALYDQIKAQKIEPVKKEKTPPKTAPSSAPQSPSQGEYQKARAQLKKTGRREDAVSVIDKILSGG